MSEKKKERFRGGPESEQFNKFKGKRVRVETVGCDKVFVTGTLVWVDVYTMGVRIEEDKEPSIIYKGPGVMISLVE